MLHRRLTAVALLLGVALAVTAQATPKIQRAFGTRYPEAKAKLGVCATCHTDSVPQLNFYGADLKRAGADFAKVDSVDSDADGIINLVEIKGLSRPGDPQSKPESKPAAKADSSKTGKKPVPDSSKTDSSKADGKK